MPHTDTLIRQDREQRAHEAYDNAERPRIYQDETTWLAETVDAPLEKEREYNLINGDLYSEEGVNLREVFDTSIEHYEQLAKTNPELAFQYRRSLLEREEYDLMRDMAAGKGGNTLIVWSTYPPELFGATKDVLGYKHKRQLGFIRAIKRVENGSIKMWTHTFDRNDPDAIEAMYRKVGHTIDWSRDPLGQRAQLDLDPIQQELIGDELLYAHDATLNAKYGGNWYAGRSETDRREAVAFVEAQKDLVAEHVEQMLLHGQKPGFKDNARYNAAIALRRRYEGRQIQADSAGAEMASAGAAGRSNGEDVGGCGLTIEAGSTRQGLQGLQESGYNIMYIPEGEHRDVCMQCPKCQSLGVLVNKRGKRVDYTCLNSRCKATTVPKKKEPQYVASSSALRGRAPSKAELINVKYGKYARRQVETKFGDADELVVDSRNGEVIDKL